MATAICATINDGKDQQRLRTNMNCPRPIPDSGFFATLPGQQMCSIPADSNAATRVACLHVAISSVFDGWSMQNQIVPAPYETQVRLPEHGRTRSGTGSPLGAGSLQRCRKSHGFHQLLDLRLPIRTERHSDCCLPASTWSRRSCRRF